jgi:RNA polymerase sigma-70 factor (ECF subfamily)
VFLRAFKYLNQYRTGTSFRSWLIGIAQNTILQELRRSKRYAGRLSRYAHMVEDRLTDLTLEEDDGRTRALRDCIGKLEKFCARTVCDRYMGGRTIEEISASCGRSNGAIRNLLYRARAQLRTCLERKGTWSAPAPASQVEAFEEVTA